MRVATRAELPVTHTCLRCTMTKPIGEMVLIHHKRGGWTLRATCKACNNERERGHRREYKRAYLRRWRANNPDLNEANWRKYADVNREKHALRAAAKMTNPRYHAASLIQGRLRRRLGMHVSIAEAKQMARKFGPCYPTRYGLTPLGLKECERIRSRTRHTDNPLSSIEIRMMVYEDSLDEGRSKSRDGLREIKDGGDFVIKPTRQQMPYRNAAEKLRNWWKSKRQAKAKQSSAGGGSACCEHAPAFECHDGNCRRPLECGA